MTRFFIKSDKKYFFCQIFRDNLSSTAWCIFIEYDKKTFFSAKHTLYPKILRDIFLYHRMFLLSLNSTKKNFFLSNKLPFSLKFCEIIMKKKSNKKTEASPRYGMDGLLQMLLCPPILCQP